MALVQHTDKGGRPRTRENILASRPNRTPINGARDVLKADGVPRGLHARWVNDVDDRILRFKEAGYEFLTTTGIMVGERSVEHNPDAEQAIGSVVCKRVGHANGQPLMAYLMVIEKEFFEEDQRKKQERINRKEKGIAQPNREEGQYGQVTFS